jgi:peptidoglycan/LPS O-acetylase OafA/YrhL
MAVDSAGRGWLRDDWTLGHRRGLDGLRGIAIVLVLMLHWWPTTFTGGAYGVDLFFVLSGFLITRLLLEEHRATGRVDIRAFYVRRARRLAPALIVVLAVCATANGAIWTLLYVANWSRASGGMAGPLEHTWSLSIEEQFYLVWPLLFILVRRSRVALGLVTAAAALVALHRIGWYGQVSHARLTNGTDTHSDGLLIGCAAAFAVPWLSRIRWTAAATVVGVPFLLIGLGAIRPGAWWLTADGGGYTAAALASAVLVLWALEGGSRILTVRPLRALGVRAYSLYLWHYPVLIAARRGDVYNLDLWTTVAAIAGGVAAAEVSYRWIEMPFRSRRQDERRATDETTVPAAASLS